MNLKKLPWIKQAKGSTVCASVAILNAFIWRGEKVNRRMIKPLHKQIKSNIDNGADIHKVAKWINKTPLAKRLLYRIPPYIAFRYLDKGNGLLLDFLYMYQGQRMSHLMFVCKYKKGQYLAANYKESENYSILTKEQLRNEIKTKWLDHCHQPLCYVIPPK
jgi:hypothetical protein